MHGHIIKCFILTFDVLLFFNIRLHYFFLSFFFSLFIHFFIILFLLKMVYYAREGCIYLIKNLVKTVIFCDSIVI